MRWRTPSAFAAAALRHPEPFVAPQPLDLLVVDVPALAAGVVVGAAVTPPRMGFGVVPQPLPQRRRPDRPVSSSAGWWRWVVRCCPVTRQANRSLTPITAMRWCTAARRRAGLRSFPRRSPSTPPSPAPRRRAAASAWRSPAPGPSASWRRRPSTRRTGSATGSRSAPTTPSSRQTSATSLPSPSSRSAWVSLRTTCSGVCRFLVVIVIKPSCPTHGRQDSHSTRINQQGSWT